MSSCNELSGLIASKILSLQKDKYPSSDMKADNLAAHKEKGWVSQIEWEYLKWNGWDSLRKDQNIQCQNKTKQKNKQPSPKEQ